MVNTKMGIEKALWQKYSKWVLTGLTVFLLVYGGGQYYRSYQTKQTLKASAAYDALLTAMQKRDTAQVKKEAGLLTERFSKTPYASLAALLLAKLAVEENNLTAAKEHLHFVLKGDNNGHIEQITKVRLARILADEKDYEAALTLLTKENIPDGYKTLFEETKGDIYLMQNDKEKAREAYEIAIGAAPPGVPLTRLQLKQANLGVKEGS